MELNIIEDKKSRMVFELKDEDHTMCNAITNALWNEKGVKSAAYNIDHPLVGVPKIMIDTDSTITPKEALKKAIASLEKINKEFLTKFSKIAK